MYVRTKIIYSNAINVANPELNDLNENKVEMNGKTKTLKPIQNNNPTHIVTKSTSRKYSMIWLNSVPISSLEVLSAAEE